MRQALFALALVVGGGFPSLCGCGGGEANAQSSGGGAAAPEGGTGTGATAATGTGAMPATGATNAGGGAPLTGGGGTGAGSGGAATGGVGATGGGGGRGADGGTGGDGATTGGGTGATDGGGTSGSGATAGGGTSGASGSAGAGGEIALPPTVSGLTIEPNPNSTISAFVSWTTDVAADSEVQFGIGDYQFRIRHDEPVTDHRVLVIGMYAESDYLIRAVSTNSGGSDSAEGSFATGVLPETLPLVTLTANDAASQPGWTATTVQPAVEGVFPERPPGLAVMYDQQGIPVWYYVNGDLADELGDVSIDALPNGNLLLGPSTLEPPKEVDLAGEVIWRGPEQPEQAPGAPANIMTHHAGKLSNGNYILLRNFFSEFGEDEFQGALIEEVTPDNQVVWDWNLFDHLQPDPLVDDTEWCHPNAVWIDEVEDVLYLSCRWLGVIKAHRSGDQSVIWTLGLGLDGGSFTFDPPEAGFADEHDPEFHDDGTILIYDNDGYNLMPTGDEHTRVLEFALDEQTMVASLVWSFPGSFAVDAWYHDEWYTPFWGDADRLANQNVLITAGMRDRNLPGHIFEVTREEGQVVWEIEFPPNAGCYQAERISPPPLVEPL